jgi:hypothetical protein
MNTLEYESHVFSGVNVHIETTLRDASCPYWAAYGEKAITRLEADLL